MKDVYCINIRTKPNTKFYELLLEISRLYNVKMTHYVVDVENQKPHSGRLGEKGMQSLKDVEYDNLKSIETYNVITKKIFNALFETSDVISCEHYASGYRFIIIVEELNKYEICLEDVMQIFIDEDVINAYCFKYDRALLPETIFWGVYSTAKETAIERTENEDHLIELFSKIKYKKPLSMPQIFSKMFIKLDDDNEIEKICHQLGYEFKRLGQGVIISTSENMRVPLDARDNKLAQYLEEKGVIGVE